MKNTQYPGALTVIEDYYSYINNRYYNRQTLLAEVMNEFDLDSQSSKCVLNYVYNNSIMSKSWDEHVEAFNIHWYTEFPEPKVSWFNRILNAMTRKSRIEATNLQNK